MHKSTRVDMQNDQEVEFFFSFLKMLNEKSFENYKANKKKEKCDDNASQESMTNFIS